jgi:MFS family permease
MDNFKMTLARNKQIILLIGIILAATITAINLTMAVSSLPEIQKAFNTSLVQLKWFISLYLIAQSALMANMARIGVIFGVRRVLYFGIISFILVSIIAGT